jgi:flagellar motor protein MotB
VAVSGKGSDNPVAPNDTAENKAKNRRVEISIPRAD